MHCIFKKLINGLGTPFVNIFWTITMIILGAVAVQILVGMLYVVAYMIIDLKVLYIYYIYFGTFGWVSLFGFLFYKAAIWLIDAYDECKWHESI